MNRAVLAVLALCVLVTAGCTGRWARADVRADLDVVEAERSRPAPSPFGLDAPGVLHMHTRLSHDSPAPLEELVHAAPRAGLRWVAFSEHGDTAREPSQVRGVIDGVLYIPGEELSRWGGAVLSLGARRSLAGISKRMPDTVEAVHEAGGIAVLGHWVQFGFTPGRVGDAMAVYDLTRDVRDLPLLHAWDIFANIGSGDPRRAEEAFLLWLLQRPASALEGWDRVLAEGPFSAVAETNAHAKFRFLGRTWDPYLSTVSLVRNHALVATVDEPSVLEALGRGRLHIGFDAAGDTSGFRFEAWRDDRPVAAMGDAVPWDGRLRLAVHLPLPSVVRLLRDGVVIARVRGRVHYFAPPGPGVYRVEADLDVDGRDVPWVISNPVRVVAPEAPR